MIKQSGIAFFQYKHRCRGLGSTLSRLLDSNENMNIRTWPKDMSIMCFELRKCCR
jgi:hypothetical protein